MGNKPTKSIITSFDGTNVPDNFEFPSIEIEDIDRSIFDLFDKTISFETEIKGKSRKVPVVFAAGERFALTRRKNPIRDRNNALILPLISIMRADIDISPNQHGFRTPIAFNDQPGYYIKKRLHDRDRNYQNLINKQGLKNQDNVASRKNFGSNTIFPGNTSKAGTIASRRNNGNLSFSNHNNTLSDNLNNNIFEIIEIPYPKFIAVKYTIVFWAQYLTQANKMLQTLFRSFTGQAHEIAMKTDAGFELVAFFDNQFSSDTNFDNYSDEERLIKHTIGFTVPGYMLNPKSMKGMPRQIRSYVSAPMIEFGYNESKTNIVSNNQSNKNSKDKINILTDLTNEASIRSSLKRGESNEDLEIIVVNPFTDNKEISYSKVLTRNKRSGESVISPLIVKKLESQYE
jgi:hypothetical protein